MPHKPAHFIFYLSTLQKPAAGAGFYNVLKYKAGTFYLSMIQKPAPGLFNVSRVALNSKNIVQNGNDKIKICKSGHKSVADTESE